MICYTHPCLGVHTLLLLTYCYYYLMLLIWLALWLSDNALPSINVVVLRQTRLVPGWVTVCGRVNHLGM